jgi:hypothetical protein
LEPNGYVIQLLENLHHNVEIVELNLSYAINVGEKLIELNKISGCLTSLFIVPQNLDDKDTELTFKRVENFQEMNEINKMIRNVYERTGNERTIIDSLIKNFGITDFDAISHISNFLNSFTRINGKYVNNEISIAEMAGFPVKFEYNPFSKLYKIDVENINAVDYIGVISIYIDSILRIFLEPSSIDMNSIQSICTKQVEELVPVIPTVVSNNIQPITFKKNNGLSLLDDEDEMDESNDIAFVEEDEEEIEPTNAEITERVIEAISGDSREPTVPSDAPSLSSVEDEGVVFIDDDESREPTIPSAEDDGTTNVDNEKNSKETNSSIESGVVFMDDDGDTNTPSSGSSTPNWEGASGGTVGSLEKEGGVRGNRRFPG